MLDILTQWLIGDFSNHTQALNDPIWFVNLRLWHRPVTLFSVEKRCVFAEQANVLQLDQPYRQRLMELSQLSEQQWHIQYWAFRDPTQYRGAGHQPELLNDVTQDDLIQLPGCQLWVTYENQVFTASPKPDLKCCFEYAGQTRQVELGFTCAQDRFTSYDRGVNLETGEPLWGAIFGPYQFEKVQARHG